MKERAIGILVAVVLFAVGYFAVYGLRSYNTNSTSLDRDSYVRIAQKACVTEATKYSGVTDAQANQYCKCSLDKLYAGKSVEDMRKMDAEVVNGALPEKYDYIITSCASQTLN